MSEPKPNEKCNGCIYKESFWHGFGVGSISIGYRCKVLQDMSKNEKCEWKKEK